MAGCLITLNAFGQATIKGQVVDATGEPVIGASILVKDTKNGAVSDLDGGYTLNNVKDRSEDTLFPYSLHYDLFTHIIKTFLVNSDRAQLIFSTHSLMLLDEDFIRRDMVYFASKNESGATEIYRAKDFGLHKEVSILNAYRAGKLGAKPQLGSIFIDE